MPSNESHCIGCGRPLRNIVRCAHCEAALCSEMCFRRHLKTAHVGGSSRWFFGLVAIAVIFVASGAVFLFCCGGLAMVGHSSMAAPETTSGRVDGNTPTISPVKPAPAHAARVNDAKRHIGRDLTRDETIAFGLLWSTEQHRIVTDLNGSTVGVTGVVAKAEWYRDRSEGLTVQAAAHKGDGARQIVIWANFEPAYEREVLQLQPGDVATVRGVIDDIQVGNESVTIGLERCRVIHWTKSETRLAAEKRKAATDEAERKARDEAAAKMKAGADEKAAEAALVFARDFLKSSDPKVRDKGFTRLKALIEKYPHTEAAKEAEKLLKTK